MNLSLPSRKDSYFFCISFKFLRQYSKLLNVHSDFNFKISLYLSVFIFFDEIFSCLICLMFCQVRPKWSLELDRTRVSEAKKVVTIITYHIAIHLRRFGGRGTGESPRGYSLSLSVRHSARDWFRSREVPNRPCNHAGTPVRTHANVIPGGTLGSGKGGGRSCRRDVWVSCTHARAGLVSLKFTLVKVGEWAARRFSVERIRQACRIVASIYREARRNPSRGWFSAWENN